MKGRISAGILALIIVNFTQFTFATTNTKAAKKEWTFMIFLNGDNNLEMAGYDDVHEMEKYGSNADVNIVVQFDGLSPQGTKRLYVTKGDGKYSNPKSFDSKVLEDMQEQDMGKTQTFKDFVLWGMQNYPANHYFVVMWNHGSGFSKSARGISDMKGISYDDTSNTYIKTNELEETVKEIVAESGNRIDVFGFDACLMGMVEIADSLSSSVDYLIASEETEPLDGYPYDDFLKAFYARKRASKTSVQLVTDMVKKYGASYSGGSQGTSSVTQSAIDLSKIALVKEKLGNWISAVQDRGIVTRSQFIASVKKTTDFYYSEYKDLGHYVTLVMSTLTSGRGGEADAGALNASLDLLKAIDEAVVENFNSRSFKDAKGLSIYIPYSSYGSSSWSYPTNARTVAYRDLDFAKTSAWPSHLDLLFPSE